MNRLNAYGRLRLKLSPVIRRSTCTVSGLTTLWLAGFNSAHAQGNGGIRPYSVQETVAERAVVNRMIGLGLLGMVAGGVAGYGLGNCCLGGGFGDLDPRFVGVLAGETLGMALGVHLGNRRRGNLLLDALAGALVLGAGFGAAALSDGFVFGGIVALSMPFLQLGVMVSLEQKADVAQPP